MQSEFSLLFVTVALVVVAPPELQAKDGGQIWAVLVAGSSGYDNYRHQADVCHAYQILHRHGVPDSNIIVMMYDDIANNDENPKKGKIINRPNGPDVYKGVPKDYTGDAVTPENFIKVLTGKGPGKVLKSGKDDTVFVNFVDHGATGIIGFPNTVMHARALIKALKKMHKLNMYKKLVFYLEACESGSMFDKILSKNIGVYASTAANPYESSYGWYCGIPEYETCLGDLYSVNWMEDVDTEEKQKQYTNETLYDQYKIVVKKTNMSHPKLYGQKDIGKDLLDEFLGEPKKRTYNGMKHWSEHSDDKGELVSSREIAVYNLQKKIERAANELVREQLQKKLDTLLKGRKSVDQLLAAILSHVTDFDVSRVDQLQESRTPLNIEMLPCYETIVDYFNKHCVNISKNTYTLGHMYKLANLCHSGYSEKQVLEAFYATCRDHHRELLDIN